MGQCLVHSILCIRIVDQASSFGQCSQGEKDTGRRFHGSLVFFASTVAQVESTLMELSTHGACFWHVGSRISVASLAEHHQ